MKMTTFAACVALLVTVGVCEANICCMMPQWEGTQGLFQAFVRDGNAKTQEGSAQMAFDTTNQRLFMSYNIDNDGQKISYQLIMNYKTHMQYMITNGVCHKSINNVTMTPACIPDDAKLLQTASIGMGTSKIPTTSYSYSNGDTTVLATITAGCIPVYAVTKGSTKEGVEFTETLGYFNIKSGIQNTTVFTPPASCNSPVARMRPKRHVNNLTFMGRVL